MAKYKNKISFWNTSKNTRLPKYDSMTSILFNNAGDVDVKLNGTYLIPAGTTSPGINASLDGVFDIDMDIVFDAATLGVNPLLQAVIIEKFPIGPSANGNKNCELL